VKPSVYGRFLQCVDSWPESIAVEIQNEPPERVTYRQLQSMAESIGRWLSENRLGSATHCAIFASNSPRWVAAYLGTIAAGCVAIPLDPSFNADVLHLHLVASDATMVFSDSQHWEILQGALTTRRLPAILLDAKRDTTDFVACSGQTVQSLDSILAVGANNFTPVVPTLNDTAAILFTSGTTGSPMGVMLTHENLITQVEAVLARLRAGPGDAILSVLPLFHALPQTANLLLPLSCGARIVYITELNTVELVRALRECDITLFCGVPQLFYLMHERIFKEMRNRGRATFNAFRFLLQLCNTGRRFGLNLGRLLFRQIHEMLGTHMRYLITGGARCDERICKDFYALGFNILQGYGLTETSGTATCTFSGNNVVGSVGPPLSGVEINVLDMPDVEGLGLHVGEIIIRGKTVMKGYYRRPDATAEVLQDGWLRTGDLGFFDSAGSLHITGRKKEMIVLSSGKNIYPDDVEQHYLKSPVIKEICVLGLESGHGEPFAEHIHAVIVPNFELMRERRIVNIKEALRFDVEELSSLLPASKRIISYEIRQCDLPRTTTGKLKRFEIGETVRHNKEYGVRRVRSSEAPLSPDDQLWLAKPGVARVIDVIHSATNSNSSPIYPCDNLELDLGLDSLRRVEFFVEVQQELGICVPESAMSEVYTVREFVDLVLTAANNSPSARTTRMLMHAGNERKPNSIH
jgi:long-chain acyl-CoA synthetase